MEHPRWLTATASAALDTPLRGGPEVELDRGVRACAVSPGARQGSPPAMHQAEMNPHGLCDHGVLVVERR